MTDTKLREAFEAEIRCEEKWGHRSLLRNKQGGYANWCVDLMWDVWQAALAAPAAEPEQSTRLRGGVPEVWGWAIVDKDGHARADRTRYSEFFGGTLELEPLSEDHVKRADQEWPGCAPHRLVTLYTAAPQAPAPEQDAGVVRDAERWRKFVSLEYKVRREWAANLSLTPVLAEWVDSLPALPSTLTKDKQQ